MPKIKRKGGDSIAESMATVPKTVKVTEQETKNKIIKRTGE